MIAALGWIFFGLVVGLLAKAIMPGKDPGKFIGTTVITMVGGVIGGYEPPMEEKPSKWWRTVSRM